MSTAGVDAYPEGMGRARRRPLLPKVTRTIPPRSAVVPMTTVGAEPPFLPVKIPKAHEFCSVEMSGACGKLSQRRRFQRAVGNLANLRWSERR